jgi:hypothetical protein
MIIRMTKRRKLTFPELSHLPEKDAIAIATECLNSEDVVKVLESENRWIERGIIVSVFSMAAFLFIFGVIWPKESNVLAAALCALGWLLSWLFAVNVIFRRRFAVVVHTLVARELSRSRELQKET